MTRKEDILRIMEMFNKKSIPYDEICVGDLVRYRTYERNESVGYAFAKYNGKSIIPPTMVVTEIMEQSENKKQGVSDAPIHKRCKTIWYSAKTGCFNEQWFDISLLKKVYPSENIGSFECGEIVTLATFNAERIRRIAYGKEFIGKKNDDLIDNNNLYVKDNTESDNQQETSENSHLDKKGKQSKSIFIVKYLPPYMIVTKIMDNKSIKCKWYNSVAEKFSENIFPATVLIKIEN